MNTFENAYIRLINEDIDNTDQLEQPVNFSINVNLENAVFTDPESRDSEIIRILEKVISDIEDGRQLGQDSWPIMDINGNKVGEVTYN